MFSIYSGKGRRRKRTAQVYGPELSSFLQSRYLWPTEACRGAMHRCFLSAPFRLCHTIWCVQIEMSVLGIYSRARHTSPSQCWTGNDNYRAVSIMGSDAEILFFLLRHTQTGNGADFYLYLYPFSRRIYCSVYFWCIQSGLHVGYYHVQDYLVLHV